MTVHDALTVRQATPADADRLARLIDIAGEGIPVWLWSRMAEPGRSPLEVGAARARRDAGGFSYRNALVACLADRPVGMALGYVIAEPTPADRAALDDLPPPLRPFVALEHASVGSFYVNALAVLPGHRGAGIGRHLLDAAEARAGALGARTMSIQVYAQNQGAVRLYTRHGYRVVAREPVLLHPCYPYYDGDVLLLLKDVAETET
jgi:ribosomal protein S18 acetylase RimI-like enzyme